MMQHHENYNKHITSQFDILLEVIKVSILEKNDQRDQFRLMQINKGNKIISRYHKKIEKSDISSLSLCKGIGSGIIQRVYEILDTGHLRENTINPMGISLLELSSVHGVGLITAREYYHKGIKSVVDLKQQITEGMKLPMSITLGVRYYDDIRIRVKREEIDDINIYLKDHISTRFTICGSYLRGKKTSKDIDVLIVRNNDFNLKDLISHLYDIKFLRAHLTVSNLEKYEGICKFGDNPHHRIDFLVTSLEDYATSLMHFTGSGTFNKLIRMSANKKGLKLSNRGLYNRDTGEKYMIGSEEEIFQMVGMKYITPAERDL